MILHFYIFIWFVHVTFLLFFYFDMIINDTFCHYYYFLRPQTQKIRTSFHSHGKRVCCLGPQGFQGPKLDQFPITSFLDHLVPLLKFISLQRRGQESEYTRPFSKTPEVRVQAPANQRRDRHSVLATIPENEDLKSEQRQCLVNFIKRKDVIALLPMGFGKNLIYQLSLLAENYIRHDQTAAIG
ncbi:hypothetical protein NL108_013948 [Boleophthalmus pectinirostris]|nr:hypothetical protein NL108_013948 [Boleophthalmus pectinirostris]